MMTNDDVLARAVACGVSGLLTKEEFDRLLALARQGAAARKYIDAERAFKNFEKAHPDSCGNKWDDLFEAKTIALSALEQTP